MSTNPPPGVGPAPGNKPREDLLTGLLDPNSGSYLGNKYKPQFDAANAMVQQSLAGLGGFTFEKNADGTLKINYDPNHALGDSELNAVHNQYNRANAANYFWAARMLNMIPVRVG